MLVLDLCCGYGGFSRAFRDRGHRVVGVDLVDPCDVRADISRLPFRAGSMKPDVILAAPPCTEYSRESMPWCRRGEEPDHTLMRAAWRAVEEYRPRYWAIENVRGAQRYFPGIRMRVRNRYLWGNFPLFAAPVVTDRKESLGPNVYDRPRIRAIVEYSISMALCMAIEKDYLSSGETLDAPGRSGMGGW